MDNIQIQFNAFDVFLLLLFIWVQNVTYISNNIFCNGNLDSEILFSDVGITKVNLMISK